MGVAILGQDRQAAGIREVHVAGAGGLDEEVEDDRHAEGGEVEHLAKVAERGGGVRVDGGCTLGDDHR